MSAQIFRDAKVWVGAADFTGDLNALALNYGAELQDASVLSDASRRRRSGLKTIAFNLTGFFNGGASGIDDLMYSEISIANEPVTMAPLTGVEAELAYFFNAQHAQYQPGGQVGQMFKFTASGEASDGRDLIRGTILRKATDTVTVDGTVMNLGAVSAAQKLYAVLHVFPPVAGASPTLNVIIQSAASVGFSGPTTRITFGQKIGINSEYATPVAGPITDAYWRALITIGGTGGPSFPLAVVIGIQ